MRLAFLAPRSSIHAVRWVNAMAQRGHEVHLLSMHSGGDPLDDRVIFHRLPKQGMLGYYLNAVALRRALERIGPDVLHVHYASGYGTLARLSEFHPRVLSVWGSDVFDFPYESYLKMRIVQKNIRTADWVTSTSHVMASQVYNICPDVSKMSVVPFGVDLNIFYPGAVEQDSTTTTIGTVKALAPKYGIDLLIKAFSEVYWRLRRRSDHHADKLRLLIVGDGPQRRELEALARGLQVGEVTEFVGAVPHDLVPYYLRQLDVYVAASRSDSESFGVAVVEASACGKPVVVTDVGGLPEVVVRGHTGYVVPSEDVKALADALLRLIEDESLRHRMGAAGRRHVISHYDWQCNVVQMEDIYQRVVNGSANTGRVS